MRRAGGGRGEGRLRDGGLCPGRAEGPGSRAGLYRSPVTRPPPQIPEATTPRTGLALSLAPPRRSGEGLSEGMWGGAAPQDWAAGGGVRYLVVRAPLERVLCPGGLRVARELGRTRISQALGNAAAFPSNKGSSVVGLPARAWLWSLAAFNKAESSAWKSPLLYSTLTRFCFWKSYSSLSSSVTWMCL